MSLRKVSQGIFFPSSGVQNGVQKGVIFYFLYYIKMIFSHIKNNKITETRNFFLRISAIDNTSSILYIYLRKYYI